jgi:hypothetical protein
MSGNATDRDLRVEPKFVRTESSLADPNKDQVPSVDTLEKMARALEVPRYRLFTDDDHV